MLMEVGWFIHLMAIVGFIAVAAGSFLLAYDLYQKIRQHMGYTKLERLEQDLEVYKRYSSQRHAELKTVVYLLKKQVEEDC